WQSEWWNDQRTAAAATSLVVSRGTVLTGQDATLARKAEISGTVTGPDGRPLAGVAVRALDAEGEEFGTAVTDFDGRYGIRGLDAGRYTLAFTKAGGAYRGQYWGGATTRDDAEYLTIERGERVTGRDVRLSRDD
ncbi:MAG: carboxypeptidase-like regulatory domain-containing protein, partial [Herbiconiux sp.]|nr:carboxypeptidase-like regulatory domain-containing protein [Herbiconiux sp.]